MRELLDSVRYLHPTIGRLALSRETEGGVALPVGDVALSSEGSSVGTRPASLLLPSRL